ncbi:MAG: hypothetical protein Q8Q09_24345 [Deltaproteobacteria bacterium]|nr:hypothetical protein [Deltaproteobacteria bacterium]
MSENLLRFVELARHELGGRDAFIMLGGRAPDDPHCVSQPLSSWARVVVCFDHALDAPVYERQQERLRLLVESFSPKIQEEELPTLRAVSAAQAPLDEALGLLARRARAEEAVVIDHASPEVWGSSEIPRDGLSVDDASVLSRTAASLASIGESLADLVLLDDASVRDRLRRRSLDTLSEHTHHRSVVWARSLGLRASDAMRLRVARTIAAARAMESGAEAPQDLWIIVRPFANIYRLVLLFDGAPSALHVESALLKMLPLIERLVLALPPRDPMHSGGKVTPLRRLRPV